MTETKLDDPHIALMFLFSPIFSTVPSPIMHATWLGTACLCLVEGLDMS